MAVAMKLTSVGAAFLILAVATGAEAQGIKKYITPDGRTIYSDVPVPGARAAGEIAPPAQVDPEAQRSAAEIARKESELSKQADGRLQKLSARHEKILEAEAQLEMARSAQASGKDPLAGEHIGVVGGGTRLTDAYYERQQANERAVLEAQRYLEQARAEP